MAKLAALDRSQGIHILNGYFEKEINSEYSTPTQIEQDANIMGNKKGCNCETDIFAPISHLRFYCRNLNKIF